MLLNEVVGDTMRMLGRVVGENIEVKVRDGARPRADHGGPEPGDARSSSTWW